jgi:DNA polymerase
MSEIESIKSKVISCTKCGLSKTRANAVPGKGKSDAEIMFIGEAPGRNEDLKGEPFVGTAGRILSEALALAGLSREDVYITNVIKCRPPNNRIPLQEEKECCWQYLSEELEIIHPKIICILGNTAYSSLLRGNSITKNRGKIIEKDGKRYFLTIHPAAAIYNQELKSIFNADIKLLVETLDKLKKLDSNK